MGEGRIMSFGKSLSAGQILASFAVCGVASKVVHNMIIGSGSQPITMSPEFKAAELRRSLAKPMQANKDKVCMEDPQYNCAFDWETGQAAKFNLQPGDPIVLIREWDEAVDFPKLE